MATLFPHLRELIEEGSVGLPGVAPRRMFGCDAFFAYGNIYALVWSEGRIALKLPDKASFDEVMARPGAEPWTVSEGKAMSHWVLVPEDFHDEPDELGRWIRRAYESAAHAPPKKAKAPRAGAKTAAKAAAATGAKASMGAKGTAAKAPSGANKSAEKARATAKKPAAKPTRAAGTARGRASRPSRVR